MLNNMQVISSMISLRHNKHAPMYFWKLHSKTCHWSLSSSRTQFNWWYCNENILFNPSYKSPLASLSHWFLVLVASIPHCLDNRLTDGEVVQLYLLAALYSPDIFYSCSGTQFLLEAEQRLAWSQPEGSSKLINLNYLVQSRICNLLACSMVP
jgi:hypothetical protein